MEAEDYDAAKQLKQDIDLKRHSSDVRPMASCAALYEVNECVHRKRAAVEAEDYDAAKQLKLDIDRMRLSGGDVRPTVSRASPPLSGTGNRNAASPEHPPQVYPGSLSHLIRPYQRLLSWHAFQATARRYMLTHAYRLLR